MLLLPYVSLGLFKPSHFHEITIATELQAWLAERGIASARNMLSKGRLPIQVRSPVDHIRISTTDKVVTQWHRDGLGKYALDRNRLPDLKRLILWSNGTPTHLQDADGKTLPSEPYAVVLIDNRVIWHRCPASEANRWFVRLEEPIVSSIA